MNEEIENVTATPADAQAEQAIEKVEVISTDATAEHPEEVIDTPEEAEAKKVAGTQKRIDALTKEKYGYKRDVEQARIENAQLRDQLARKQQGDTDEQPGDFQSNVRQEAQRLNAEQSFNDTCNKVYAAGKAEFPDFDNAVANLQMVGVNRDFLELVTTSDAGAKLLNHLGNDLDEAARISALSPVQMVRELTRLEYKLSQTTVKPVSKAPAPIKPIGSGGSTDGGLRDDLSMDEWQRRRNKERFG